MPVDAKALSKIQKQAFRKLKALFEARVHHPIFSSKEVNDETKRLYASKKLSPNEYVELMAGHYKDHSPFDLSYGMKDILKQSPHNSPINNGKAYDWLRKKRSTLSDAVKHQVDNFDDDMDVDGSLTNNAERTKYLIENYPLPAKALSTILSEEPVDSGYGSKRSYDYSGKKEDHWHHLTQAMAKQPMLNKQHIMDVIAHPSRHLGDLVKHPSFDKEAAKSLIEVKPQTITSDQLQHMISTMSHQDESKRLIDEQGLKDIVTNGGKKKAISLALNHLPDDYRNFAVDKILGIHLGELARPADDHDNPEDAGWQNWDHGGDYNSSAAEEIIGSSEKLLPHQIDHIKRHGDFAEKIALFNNPHVDPKHGAEMWEKWYNDHSDHGYDRDEFNEHLKEENEFDYEDWYEEAQEAAQENYSLDDYISDSFRDEEEMTGENKDEWMQNHLDGMDWTVPSKQLDLEGGDTETDYSRDQESHPEYSARQEEAETAWDDFVKEYKDSDKFRERLWEGYDESISEDVSREARKLYDDEMETAHEKEKYLPAHLHGKLPQLEDLKRQEAERKEAEARKAAEAKELKEKSFLDVAIPKRDNAHPYGDFQHHAEMAINHADSAGGAIDIGSLNKLYPNLKDKWKAIFGGKGKLSSDELRQKHAALPKTPYAVSYGKWGNDDMQNINHNDQAIVRLDHTPESLAPLQQDEETHRVFRKIQEVSQRSGHPTNFNTIAWARVDASNPQHWMIDEVQSDFGSAARDYLSENGKADEAQAVDKIIAHHKNWREALINKVVNLAKQNGAQAVSTHSPESKAAHTGASKIHTVYKDSYQKVPRSMGFAPSAGETLPLSEKGKKTFLQLRSGTSTDDLIQMHKDAMDAHANLAAAHEEEQINTKEHEAGAKHGEHSVYHADMYKKHQQRLANLDPSDAARHLKTPRQYINYKESSSGLVSLSSGHREAAATHVHNGHPPKFGFDAALNEQPTQVQMQQGHTFNLNPQSIKKAIEEITDLMKSEVNQAAKTKIALTLKTIKDNQKTLQSLAESNPPVYEALMHMVQSMVSLFKKKTGEDPDALVQQLEMEQAMQEQQEQMAAQQQGGEGQPQPQGGVPNKDQPIHNRQLVYGPGAERRYSSQDDRIKDPDGEWHAHRGGIQFPDQGNPGGLDE